MGSYKVNRIVHFQESAMRSVLFALALSLSAVPAFAFGVVVDLPTLSWPQDDQTSSSTKGCEAAPSTTTAVCK